MVYKYPSELNGSKIADSETRKFLMDLIDILDHMNLRLIELEKKVYVK